MQAQRTVALISLAFVSVVVLAHAKQQFAYSVDAEKLFDNGLQLFKQKDFTKALAIFDSLAHRHSVNQRTTAAYIMAGKSLYQLGEFRESASLIADFLKTFPETNYSDDARYTLALDYLMLQWYDEAALQLLRSIEITEDPHLSARAESLFESIADERMDTNDLRQLLPNLQRPGTQDLLTLKLAQKLYANGNLLEARSLVDELAVHEQSSIYHSRIQALKEKFTNANTLKIGVLLPLMRKSQPGPVKSIAEEMLDGITFALSEYRTRSKSFSAVVMDVRDTERDSAFAVSSTREFVRSKDIIAIVGPLFSENVFACAPIADRAGVPMVSPTATSNGIAAIGPHVFQANPDFRMRGKAMAQYAVQQMGYTTLAVLSPNESMGRALTESFVAEVKRLGGTIVAEERYTPDASDLREQFINLRAAGLKLQGKSGSPEYLDVPVTSIQGIFLPVANPEEIGIIASQMKYYNVHTQFLGSGEWYDPDQLEAHKRDINGAVFTSDWYASDTDTMLAEFRNTFTAQAKKRPSRYTLFGYDVMKMILTQIESGATTREKLTAALNSVQEFPGLHSKITLTHGRVNSEMHILQYLNGEIRQVMEVSAK